MKSKNTILLHALLITSLIGGFFFISSWFGLADNPALRIVNVLFVFIGVYQVIKQNIMNKEEQSYLNNFGIGLQTGLLSVFFSILAVLIYSKWINPAFFEVLQNSVLIGKNLNIFEIIFTFALEGVAISVIASFMIMQYFKEEILNRIRKHKTDSIKS